MHNLCYVNCLEQQSLHWPCTPVTQVLHKNSKSRTTFPNQFTGHHLTCHKLLIPCLPTDQLLQPGSLAFWLQHSLQSTQHMLWKTWSLTGLIFLASPEGKPARRIVVSCACTKIPQRCWSPRFQQLQQQTWTCGFWKAAGNQPASTLQHAKGPVAILPFPLIIVTVLQNCFCDSFSRTANFI